MKRILEIVAKEIWQVIIQFEDHDEKDCEFDGEIAERINGSIS